MFMLLILMCTSVNVKMILDIDIKNRDLNMYIDKNMYHDMDMNIDRDIGILSLQIF
jgi:hypothetical protein